MTITLLQENLLPALQDAVRFISAKPQIPILSGVSLQTTQEGVLIRSTDLKVGFQTIVRGKIEKEGECVVPGKYLVELLGSLSHGPLQLSIEGQSLLITQQRTRSALSIFPSDDFPPFPKPGENPTSLPKKSFLSLIDECLFAASLDESRPVIASVFLKMENNTVTVAATDGYRLATSSIQTERENSPSTTLVSSKMLADAVRILDRQTQEEILFYDSQELSQVVFTAGDTTIMIRKTDGSFPNFAEIIPNSFSHMMKIHAKTLIQALKTALVVAKESSSIVSFQFSKGKLSVVGTSSAVGENKIEIDVNYDEEEEMSVACNAKFLLDMLSHMSEEFVELHMNSALKPILLRPEGKEEFTYIVMPFKR